MKIACAHCAKVTDRTSTFRSVMSGKRYCRDLAACDRRRAKADRAEGRRLRKELEIT